MPITVQEIDSPSRRSGEFLLTPSKKAKSKSCRSTEGNQASVAFAFLGPVDFLGEAALLQDPSYQVSANQIELAWTVIPVLIVLVLFLATARVIHGIQQAKKPPEAIEVVAIGHQFWWEYRYPKLNIVTANELHVPVSDPAHPTPTFMTLLSADTDHSFWVPRLAGKTDLIPNHPNSTMVIDPHETGLFLGQCAQYCGTQHAKMLLRVYVQPRADFDRWVREQQKVPQSTASAGERVFQSTACVSCHTVAGTPAKGLFGPDLTHLMSRDTIARVPRQTPPRSCAFGSRIRTRSSLDRKCRPWD